ncbi:DUF5958 family protein [Streptomyces sp. B21-102]
MERTQGVPATGRSPSRVADERRRERFCSGGCGHWWHNLPVADG